MYLECLFLPREQRAEKFGFNQNLCCSWEDMSPLICFVRQAMGFLRVLQCISGWESLCLSAVFSSCAQTICCFIFWGGMNIILEHCVNNKGLYCLLCFVLFCFQAGGISLKRCLFLCLPALSLLEHVNMEMHGLKQERG